MAIYEIIHDVNDFRHDVARMNDAQARLEKAVAEGTVTDHQRESVEQIIKWSEQSIATKTLNDETDTLIEGTNCALRLVKDALYRTWKVTHEYTYYGDGEGAYWFKAWIINDDGSLRFTRVGGPKLYTKQDGTKGFHDGRDSSDAWGSTPDAADELIDAHFAYAAKQAKLEAIRDFNSNAHNVAKGKYCYVVAGRKVPKGTNGRIFWVGEDNYGKLKVGFNDASGGVHWTAASNVSVVADEDVDND
jgi:hypothetical protein